MNEEWSIGTGEKPESVHVGNVEEMDGTARVLIAFVVAGETFSYLIPWSDTARIGASIIEIGALACGGTTFDGDEE